VSKSGQGRAGQGRAGQGRAGQVKQGGAGRAGQVRQMVQADSQASSHMDKQPGRADNQKLPEHNEFLKMRSAMIKASERYRM